MKCNLFSAPGNIRVIGIKAITELTDEDVIAWKRQLMSEMSKTTLAIYHRQLRAAFNRAIKWSMAEKNPFAVVEISKEAKDPSKAKNMSYEEVRKLLKVIDDSGDIPYANYIRFLLNTGCRRNEILFLHWEDIDLGNGVMKIYAQKTKRSMVIPINKALLRVIEGMERKEAGYVFQTESTSHNARQKKQPWSEDFVTHRFKKYVRKAGLPDHYSPHSLRHTYTTYLREKGVPLDIIYRLLGHSSPAVTLEHYDHTIATHFRQQADLVDFEGNEANGEKK